MICDGITTYYTVQSAFVVYGLTFYHLHHKMIMIGKPVISSSMIMLLAQSGFSNMGNTISAICIITKASTA